MASPAQSVLGTHATAVAIHRGAVGPECSVVRLFLIWGTTERPNHRTAERF